MGSSNAHKRFNKKRIAIYFRIWATFSAVIFNKSFGEIISALQFLTDSGIYPWAEEDLIRRFKAFPKLIEQLLKAPKDSFEFIRL